MKNLTRNLICCVTLLLLTSSNIFGQTPGQTCQFNMFGSFIPGIYSCDGLCVPDQGFYILSACSGCTDNSALNYDQNVVIDDGSCEYPVYGCSDPNALNYNPDADVDDGSCEYCPVGTAYDDGFCLDCPMGTYGDGLFCETCPEGTFAPYHGAWTCSSHTVCSDNQYELTIPTADSDRVCAELTFCSIDQYELIPPTATSDRVCAELTFCSIDQYELIAPTTDSDRVCAELTVCSDNQYELIAPTTDSDRVCAELTVCSDNQYELTAPTAYSDRVCVPHILGCADVNALNYNEEATDDDGSCVSWEELANNLQSELDNVVIEDGVSQEDVDAAYIAGAASVDITSDNEDVAAAAYADGVASVEITECEEVATQNIPLNLPQGWSMFGYTCLESLNVIEAFSDISTNIEIVKDEWGLAYLPAWGFSAFDNLEFGEGYQIKMIEGLTDFQFCTTIAGGSSQEELDAAIAEVHAMYDGWCESDVDNDGVCDIDEVSGCVESNACNYNVNATDDDGSCAFAFPYYDCSGLCLNDDNDNNICDELEVFGCMNETSCNYNELANMDDGSCEGLLGCTVELFSEFNPDATCDDESCEIVYACIDEASPNYQPWVLHEAMMYGGFAIHDDSMCGQEGCMIEQGCNYDPSNEFGSIDLCEFPEEGFDCNGNIFNINELQIGDYHAGGIVYILNDDGTGWVVNPIQNTVWMNPGSYSGFINQANSDINYVTNGDYGDWQLAGYNDYVTLSELFGPLSSEYPQFCNPGDYSWGFNDDNPNIMSDSEASFVFCNGDLQAPTWYYYPNVNYRLVRAF